MITIAINCQKIQIKLLSGMKEHTDDMMLNYKLIRRGLHRFQMLQLQLQLQLQLLFDVMGRNIILEEEGKEEKK